MYKLSEQQKAYARLFRNLILVDFKSKRVKMRGYKGDWKGVVKENEKAIKY